MGMRYGPLSSFSTRPLDTLRFLALLAVAMPVAVALPTPVAAQSTSPGGFLETADSTSVRLPVSVALPSRGKFTFPAPYNTTGIRVTTGGDCGGADCVRYAGYSYWRNMNNHVGSDTMYIFLGLDRNRGGGADPLQLQ